MKWSAFRMCVYYFIRFRGDEIIRIQNTGDKFIVL